MADTPAPTTPHVERPTKVGGRTYCACGSPWPCARADTPAPTAPRELRGRIGSCVEHGAAAEFYDDGSGLCIYCCQVETSCDCTEEARAAPAEPLNRDKTVENLIIALAYRYDDDEQGTPCFCVTGDAVDGKGRVISHTSRCRQARMTLSRWRSTPAEALDSERLRYILWTAHGHGELYGDDGEMQCSQCGPDWDYLRGDLPRLIERAYSAIALARLPRTEEAEDVARPVPGPRLASRASGGRVQSPEDGS